MSMKKILKDNFPTPKVYGGGDKGVSNDERIILCKTGFDWLIHLELRVFAVK